MTDRVKKDFWRWYFEEIIKSTRSSSHKKGLSEWFNDLHQSLQWGVWVDYYDSCDIYIDLQPVYGRGTRPSDISHYIINLKYGDRIDFIGDEFKTRQEARKGALEKASEIREEQL